MQRTRPLPLALLIALAPAAPATPLDRVITEDGRILRPRKVREVGEGLELVFDEATIELPDRKGIVAVEIEGDMSDYVPKDDNEREKLEQGYVRYQGKWMSKPAYENLLEKEAKESKARADDIAAHQEFENGWTDETKHFAIRTNTSPELLEYYGELFEAYYDLMDDRFKIKPSLSLKRTKMKVLIYKAKEEFLSLSAGDIGPNTLGYFWAKDGTLNFFHDYEEPAMSEWTALHECTHLLTYLIDPEFIAPIWLNEGVAEYFGAAVVSRDKRGRLEIEPGQLEPSSVLTVQQAIIDGNDVSLADLFATERDDFTGFHYAHAWSFVYFLNNSNPKYKKAFDRFFKDLYNLKKGIDFELVNYATLTGVGKLVSLAETERVVLDALKVKKADIDELDSEWKLFVADIDLDAPEARFKRGHFAIARATAFKETADQTREAMEQAVEDLDFAIDNGVVDSRALRSRAVLKMFLGDFKAGEADLDRAIELDPLNASLRFDKGRLATSFLVIGGRAELDGLEGLSKHPEALPHLSLAAELAPENQYYQEFYEAYLDS